MPTGNEKLYKDLGEVRGMLMGLDKRFNSLDRRLERMEQKQDDILKKDDPQLCRLQWRI